MNDEFLFLTLILDVVLITMYAAFQITKFRRAIADKLYAYIDNWK